MTKDKKIEVELINFGRSNLNKKIEVKNPSFKSIYKAIGKYLASKNYDIVQTDTDGLFNVEAGFRTIGQIKVPESHWMILL